MLVWSLLFWAHKNRNRLQFRMKLSIEWLKRALYIFVRNNTFIIFQLHRMHDTKKDIGGLRVIQPCLKCGKNTMTNFYCCSNEYRWNFKYQAEMQKCVSFVWVWRVICVTSITLKFNQINHGQARHVLHSARFSKALMYCYASEILVNFEFEWLHPFSSMDSGQVRFTSSHHEQTLPFHMDL